MSNYKDIFTGTVLIPDDQYIQEVDDVVFEVDCPVSSNDAPADGPDNYDNGIGSTGAEGNDVVETIFGLQETIFNDEEAFKAHFEGYFNAIENKLSLDGANDNDIAHFKMNSEAYFKNKILPKSRLKAYLGDPCDGTGMVVIESYREDGRTPYLIFWKHGLRA